MTPLRIVGGLVFLSLLLLAIQVWEKDPIVEGVAQEEYQPICKVAESQGRYLTCE